MYDAHLNVLGLMSGTSLDGMDAALVRFRVDSDDQWELLWQHTFEYPFALKELVERTFVDSSPKIIQEVDLAFARWTTACIQSVQKQLEAAGLPNIDLVGTHGQTIFHQPQQKWTFQAGCLPSIARDTKLTVITNFRMQDVLLGGQGAPLVPFGDHKLFGTYEAALNLGGFANVSLGAPLLSDGVKAAFDIVPVNIVLNEFAAMLGGEYDEDGRWAREGSVDRDVVSLLGELDFYHTHAPKSLGKEWVEANVRPLLEGLAPKDALATMMVHIADQLAVVLHGKRTLITGGGAFNGYLMELLRNRGIPVVLPSKEIIAFKEAIIFALLAKERWLRKINVLGHTTGSQINHSSGAIFTP